jgi:anti-sigma regulatory factor (Ser/Thr protein kinase)
VARRFVRDALGDLDDDTREVAVLLASELVTNAILHARTEVHLGVLLDGDNLLLSVGDRQEDTPGLVPREKSRERPGGRGLALVDELATSWGAERYTGGKTVWCVLSSVSTEEVQAG